MPAFDENIPLAPLTTLGVGGPARWLARCRSVTELRHALDWARRQAVPSLVLGGGSNLLVADRGFDGLVVICESCDLELKRAGDGVLARIAAGHDWDQLVAMTVAEGLGGIECLSGIPGRVGAAPIQNIGAYGQQLEDCLTAVEVIDRQSLECRRLSAAECGLSYRHSHFKTVWRDRLVITAIELRLQPDVFGAVRYGDLRGRLPDPSNASLAEVRRAVLKVRAEKSMLLDATDPNHLSAGSFFVNPVVAASVAERLRQQTGAGAEMPAYPALGGVKLSAAWLIERAGFRRGEVRGRVGLSSRHVLALINRGGASASELIALAGEIRRRVRQRFAITLSPEPVLVGFEVPLDELLGGSG